MTDTNSVQCIPISILSDSVTETDEECFTYTISTTSTDPGLIVSPSTATICIRDPEEGSYVDTIAIKATLFLFLCLYTPVEPDPVTIGLKQSFYSTMEGGGQMDICISALSGDFSGSNYTINYTTTDAQAEGNIAQN